MCGRRIEVPAQGVRPTKDRVRESLFAILGDRLPGASVLDLYAGSGALGLEALSRGAARVCWVERDPRTYRVLQTNVQKLRPRSGEFRTECVLSDAVRYLSRVTVDRCDIVFADPPYDKDGSGSELSKILLALDKSAVMSQSGLVVYEMSSAEPVEVVAPWRIVRERKWGDTKAVIMALESSSS